jgi:hypothetical protein
MYGVAMNPEFHGPVRELDGRWYKCGSVRMLRADTMILCFTAYRARKSIGIVEQGHMNFVLVNVLSMFNIDACCRRCCSLDQRTACSQSPDYDFVSCVPANSLNHSSAICSNLAHVVDRLQNRETGVAMGHWPCLHHRRNMLFQQTGCCFVSSRFATMCCCL